MTAPSDATRYPRGAGSFPNPIPKHGESNPKPITVTDGPYTPSITFLDQKPRSPPSNTSHRLKQRREKRRRGAKKPTVPIEERVVSAAGLPAGARFKGYETFTVQDLKIEARVVCYCRERWLLPDGRTVVAPLPAGIGDHFGPELKRFILAQYHQGQTTVPRLVELLGTLGMDISKRQVVRILTESNEAFITEARDVLRAGLSHGDWISVDDTGARHQGKNGFWAPSSRRTENRHRAGGLACCESRCEIFSFAPDFCDTERPQICRSPVLVAKLVTCAKSRLNG